MTAEEDEMDIKAKPIGRNFVEESMNAELKIYFFFFSGLFLKKIVTVNSRLHA